MTRRSRTVASTGTFPATPDSSWSPDRTEHWADVRAFGDSFPSTPGMGGWLEARLPTPAGPITALVGMLAAGVPSLVLAWLLADAGPVWELAAVPPAIAVVPLGLWIDARLDGINLAELPALIIRGRRRPAVPTTTTAITGRDAR
jgi:hypothetical protein